MDEGPKLRLVRCPKCRNVLTEEPDYSVYQCGGCGTFLRAKKKVALGGKDRDVGSFEKLEILSETEGGGGLGDASETERERDRGILHRRRKDTMLKERTVNFASTNPLSRTEENEGGIVYNASDAKRGSDGIALHGRGNERAFHERAMNLASGGLPRTENKEVLIDNSGRGMKEQSAAEKRQSPSRNWVGGDDHKKYANRSAFVHSSIDKGIGQIPAEFESSVGSLRSRVTANQWGLDRDGLGGGNLRNHTEPSAFAYPDEGPSNYHLGSSSYGHSKLVGNYNDLDSPRRVAHLEMDRAMLLKRLDELQQRLNGVSDLSENQRERAPAAGRMAPPDAYRGHATYNVPMEPSTPDKHVLKHPYFREYGHGHVPSVNHSALPSYNDPFPPQLPRFYSHQLPRQYRHQPPPNYFLGQHMNFSQELPASYVHNTSYNQVACSCVHCSSRNWLPSSQVPPTVFNNRRFPKAPSDSNLNASANPTLRQQSCSPQADPSLLFSRHSQPRARWPVDIDSDVDGFHQRFPRRPVVSRGNRRFCHPIAGGAPFITCYNCFEILTLPKKLKSRKKNPQKLQCGACSKVFLLETLKKRVIISVPGDKDQLSAEVDGNCLEFSKEVVSVADGSPSTAGVNCANDFDDHESVDFKENTPSENQKLNVSESEERKCDTSPSVSSEEEEIPDSMLVHRDVSYFVELPAKDEISSVFQESPLQKHSDDLSSNHALESGGKGSGIKWTEQEKVIVYESMSRQISAKDVSVATEVEVLVSEYLPASFSQDSVDVSKEDLSSTNKGSESIFVARIKKSFWDFSKSNQRVDNEKPNVSVNGKPIPIHMVKRAEKLAGTIEPGDYWYDVRAGFWGVIGQSCLGILPPFIEEFNYPMPEKCGAGNTGVFVNGRELHQKDLDLLSSRGLPTTRDKSYIVEISGKVFDEDSGEELATLGNLAPTVQKFNSGFGMRVPKHPARLVTSIVD